MNRALETMADVAAADGEEALRFFRALELPFAVYMLDEGRIRYRLKLAERLDGGGVGPFTAEALTAFEPHIVWEANFLTTRLECYRAIGSVLAAGAQRDLDDFVANEPVRFSKDLVDQ
jgi:hypothetical protein